MHAVFAVGVHKLYKKVKIFGDTRFSTAKVYKAKTIIFRKFDLKLMAKTIRHLA